MSTSRAQSIVSSRMSSRAVSRGGSRKGSMDVDDMEESKASVEKDVPRSKGGKIINKLTEGEQRDPT